MILAGANHRSRGLYQRAVIGDSKRLGLGKCPHWQNQEILSPFAVALLGVGGTLRAIHVNKIRRN